MLTLGEVLHKPTTVRALNHKPGFPYIKKNSKHLVDYQICQLKQ